MAKIQISRNFNQIIDEMDNEMLSYEEPEENLDFGFKDLFPELKGKGIINLTPAE